MRGCLDVNFMKNDFQIINFLMNEMLVKFILKLLTSSKSVETWSYLEKIPKYMLYQILILVNFIDLKNLSVVNKYFRNRILSQNFWQFKLRSQFGSVPSDMPNKNIMAWYYQQFKYCEFSFLSDIIRKFRDISFSHRYIAIIDELSTLTITFRPTNYNILVLRDIKKVFCYYDSIYIITNEQQLYVLGYNPYGKSSSSTAVYITDKVTHLSRRSLSLLINKDLMIYDVQPDVLKPLHKYVKYFKVRSCVEYYYISLDNILYNSSFDIDNIIAKNVRTFDFTRNLLCWIDIFGKLYVRNLKSDKSNIICHNTKKIICTDETLSILTDTGKLYHIENPTELPDIQHLSPYNHDVMDFHIDNNDFSIVKLI